MGFKNGRPIMNKNTDLELINKAFIKQEKYHYKWNEYERYYNAEHTKNRIRKLERLGRSRLFIPITRNIINIIRSIFSTSFFSQGNPIELSVTRAGSNELMEHLNRVSDYYYKKLKPNKELNKAFLSALTFGLGIVITYWNEKKEKVITTNIPITDVAFDWEACNIDDVEFIAYRFYESKRTIEDKFNTKFYNVAKAKKDVIGDDRRDKCKRYEVKEIVYTDTLEVKTYINDTLVREDKFFQLPFQYGYAIDKLPSIDSEKRKDEILVYGQAVTEFIKSLNDEINMKRNQKNDIQEEMINPSIIVPDRTQVNPSDLKKGAGKRIRAEGGTEGIMFLPTPPEYSINADLQMLDKDISDASSVNSIQQGHTGASDRRSANALAVVNANSSMRTEEMISLCNETLFEHWAKSWIRLIVKNAPDEVIDEITGAKQPFGRLGERVEVEFDININFGMTIDKEKRINDLIALLQIIAQNPNINPAIIERIFKEILTIRMGDSLNIEKLFNELKEEEAAQQMLEDAQKADVEIEEFMGGGL